MSSRHSLFDSKYDTTPSYLSRLRSASRDRLGSERPSERDQGSRLRSSTLYPPSGEANGWDGGHDAVSTSSSIAASYSTAGGGQSSISPMSTAVSLDSESLLSPNSSFSYHADGIGGGSGGHSPSSSSSRLLSVQEKMNNYSQYYQSLTQSPFRRLPMASPSQIHANSASFGVGLSELRNSQLPPVNLSRPGSFVPEHNNSISSPLKVEAPEVLTSSTSTSDDGSATPCVQSPVSNPLSSVTSPSISPPQIPSPPMPTTNKSELSPKNAEEIRAAANSSKPPTAASSSGIPRWPTVSVRQHRPLSISSFPDGPRASSVSRVMSPPPPPEKSSGTATVVNGTGDSSSHSSVAALVQKRRDARATSVERITRLLERKSMPREVVPTSSSGGGECTKKKPEEKESSDLSASTTELNGNDSKGQGQGQTSKKPKFLQNLEKKWEKLTHSGGSKTTDQEEAIVNGAPELAPTAQAASTTTKVGGGAVVSSPASPEPQQPQTRGTSEESSSQEDKNDKINESVLIRRALSPEKKVKSTSRLASAGGTVNFMLGKFKKMEQEPQVGAPAASKIPMGRPPMCSAAPTMGSRLGLGARRIQQPYSGATSDSVLTLTAAAKEMSRTADTSSNGEESGLIKSAAMVAQEKRRLQPRIEVKKDGPSNQEGPTTVDSDNKPFVASNSSLSPTTPVAPAPPPQIQIQDDSDSKGVSPAAMPSMDMSSLSPISVVDGDRTDNSEEGGPPPTKSESGSVVADDDTESVSDRILRKSFYNRFNAGGIDRNRRSHSVTPASTRRSIGSSNTANLRVNGSGGGGGTGGSKGPSAGSSSGQQQPSARRSVSPSASTVASFESKESGSSEQSSTQQNRSPSPYWSGLNKYNPNPLFKELMVNEDFRTANDVGKKAEYSRRITSKLSKLLREIESDLNSCHLTKTGSGASEDGDSAGLLLGQPSGTNSHSGGHHHHHHHHHHHQHKSGHGHGHMHSNKGTSASPMTTPFANN